MDMASVYRQEYGRCVATLVRVLGGIDLAEEAVQDAFATALVRWPATGVPANPGAWITTTARHHAIDRLRREATRDDRHAQAVLLHHTDETEELGPVRDDQLRLMFTCCHPALAPTAQVALTLRLLGGLETSEIARAFLAAEATMAQATKPMTCSPTIMPVALKPMEKANSPTALSSFGLRPTMLVVSVAPAMPIIINTSSKGPTARMRRLRKISSRRVGMALRSSQR